MAAGLAVAMLLAGPSAGQTVSATSCLDGLGVLDHRMDQDGFWLSGYCASLGWTGVPTPPGTEPNMGMRAPGLAAPGGVAPGGVAAGIAPVRSDRAGGSAANSPISPFAGVDWQTAPAQALRMLFAAGQILGQSGREEACRAVLAAAEQDYDGYVGQLRRAGVEPADIRNWRQKQLAIARPMTEAGGLAAEAVEGTELRNMQDEHLGQIADLVLAMGSGEPAFAVVRRGGFLGFGRDHVAVPWEALRATPGMDVFVLDATRRQMDTAPRVDRAALGTPEAHARLADEVRAFWAGHSAPTGGTR
jgi:hypothetical protein